MERLAIVAIVVAAFAVVTIIRRRSVERSQVIGASHRVPVHLLGDTDVTWLVFTTPTCATCGPVVDHLTASQPEATVRRLDATSNLDLVDALQVRAAPTVVRADRQGNIDVRLSGPEAATRHFDLV